MPVLLKYAEKFELKQEKQSKKCLSLKFITRMIRRQIN